MQIKCRNVYHRKPPEVSLSGFPLESPGGLSGLSSLGGVGGRHSPVWIWEFEVSRLNVLADKKAGVIGTPREGGGRCRPFGIPRDITWPRRLVENSCVAALPLCGRRTFHQRKLDCSLRQCMQGLWIRNQIASHTALYHITLCFIILYHTSCHIASQRCIMLHLIALHLGFLIGRCFSRVGDRSCHRAVTRKRKPELASAFSSRTRAERCQFALLLCHL